MLVAAKGLTWAASICTSRLSPALKGIALMQSVFAVRRYQKFSIAEDIDLVVRCELDGAISMKGQDQLLSVKALNEFDSKTTGALSFILVVLLSHPHALWLPFAMTLPADIVEAIDDIGQVATTLVSVPFLCCSAAQRCSTPTLPVPSP